MSTRLFPAPAGCVNAEDGEQRRGLGVERAGGRQALVALVVGERGLEGRRRLRRRSGRGSSRAGRTAGWLHVRRPASVRCVRPCAARRAGSALGRVERLGGASSASPSPRAAASRNHLRASARSLRHAAAGLVEEAEVVLALHDARRRRPCGTTGRRWSGPAARRRRGRSRRRGCAWPCARRPRRRARSSGAPRPVLAEPGLAALVELGQVELGRGVPPSASAFSWPRARRARRPRARRARRRSAVLGRRRERRGRGRVAPWAPSATAARGAPAGSVLRFGPLRALHQHHAGRADAQERCAAGHHHRGLQPPNWTAAAWSRSR